ncbi:hypothetical protein P4T38_11515 [Bacillus safensis]|uniref:hypothetical protein n=1 Tax=Bacillus safensis TaxID=561879 RepID=UPI00227F6BA7|nr:hypothetical protein [Bacillus safensis]MCY7709532.1 hypothetical protein [Bacillus safensis]MCY7729302.1 hypothetical protein [Bacillus safensis]MED0883342.1 hypothetical protein [Bacillus safensis]MED0917033.1 hypothetical protein [Bacillus safensis]
MSYVSYQKNDVRVVLGADESIQNLVISKVHPYIDCSKLTERHEGDVWTILTSEYAQEIKKEIPLEEVFYETKMEPRCRYLYQGEKKVIVIDEPKDDRWAAQHALRLIRVLLRLLCYQDGLIYLHGGMMEMNQKGIALVGGSRAGKTSTILSLLSLTDARYITNDDIGVSYTNTEYTGTGWPRSMSIRKDSFEAIEKLGTPYRLQTSSHPFNEDDKSYHFVYPEELEKWFAREVKTMGKIDVIVFPEFLPHGQTGAELSKMTSHEAAERLNEHAVINPGRHNEFLLPFFTLPTPEELEPFLNALAEKVPCYSLKQAFTSLDKGTVLIQELLEQSDIVV